MLSTALVITLIAWIVLIPVAVVAITEVGWRIGERRRARHFSLGTVVPMPDRLRRATPGGSRKLA